MDSVVRGEIVVASGRLARDSRPSAIALVARSAASKLELVAVGIFGASSMLVLR